MRRETKEKKSIKLSRWSCSVIETYKVRLFNTLSRIFFHHFSFVVMSIPTVVSRSRVSPLGVATIEQSMDPSVTYDEVTLCTDPNCPVCRAQRRDKSHKHRRHHHKRHHHTKSKRKSFWDGFLRTESAGSTVSVHSVRLNERRPVYNEQVIERSVVPVEQRERQVVSRTQTKRYNNDEVVREAWVRSVLSISLSRFSFTYGSPLPLVTLSKS